ncbi:hypothetical protein B0T18DRAFT_388221 [Schizothecium vesticola]|uniref:Uncharacterized protein n=1 Tax=Schizothecium vesticola TaxID=314040 RepID=A0AA40KAN7_9PEZI|nr:hypothetical protein B0T18DRAFT_388221 [Schizothecium vesticola]
MGLADRYPSTRAAVDARAPVRVSTVTLPALIAILIAGTFILVVGAVYFGLWFSRRNAERKDREAREDTLSVQGDFTPIGRRSSSRKLQKAGWQAMRSEETLVPGRRHHQRSLTLPMLPRVFSVRRPSQRWAAMESHVKNGKTHPSWIDADALHGPEMNTYQGERARESWPLGPMPPTIPKMYHTVHGHPRGDNSADGDSLQGIDHVRSAYGQLRMFSRVLPEPPQPALVASHNRQLSRAASTGHGSYFNGELQRQRSGSSSNQSSPVRSLPPTPTKIRPRQPSTDTTLSNILKSTERRLQEVAGSRSGGMSISPNRMGTSRESLLIHAEKAEGCRRLSRSLTQPRTPSPNKTVPTRSATMGHKRQPSETSIISETDSALEELLVQSPPSGLSSPSRKQPTPQEPEPVIPPTQSVRSSVSSSLSTVYSEDERSEAAKTANNTPCGAAAESVKNIMVRPEPMGDPFSRSPRPATTAGWLARHKGPDLFRESLERSQAQRRRTLGQPASDPPETKLPPCPAVAGRKSLALPPPMSHLPRPERRTSTPDSLSKIPIKVNPISQQQAANLAKLSAIILPPPTASGIPIPYRPTSPDQPGSPTRLSRTNNLGRHSSVSSSVYSQDATTAKPSPALVNMAAFQTNNNTIHPPLFQNNTHQPLFQTTATTLNPPLFRATPPTPSPPRHQNNTYHNNTHHNNTPRPTTFTFDPMNSDTYLPPSLHRPLTLTIAELRRMNSAFSIASSVSDGYGREGSPSPSPSPLGLMLSTPRRRTSGVARADVFSPGSGGGGSRAYLSLGGGGGGSASARRRHSSRIGRSGSPRRRPQGGGSAVVGQTQGGVPPFRVVVQGEDGAKDVVGLASTAMTTPTKRRRLYDDDQQKMWEGLGGVVWESPAKRLARRGSQESLGLYDADGFLISTPMRKTASGSGATATNLFKVQGSPLRA